MTCRPIPHLLLLGLASVGCAGGSAKNLGDRDAGSSADGAGAFMRDAAADVPATRADTARGEAVPTNVFADAPPYNWDTTGAGGAGGAGGLDAGTSARGGSPGTGGAAPDARVGADLPPPSIDAGFLADAAQEAGAAWDSAPGDARAADSLPACVAEIVPVLPVALPDNAYMVAADSIRIVLRAQVVSGSLAATTPWSWRAQWNGQPLKVDEISAQDPAAAAFLIAKDGDYVFTAAAGGCIATFARSARRAGGCYECDHGADVKIVPPPSYDLPTQGGYFSYSEGIGLAESHVVRFFTSVGNHLVPSYVRITNPDGSLVTDGYADPSSGFGRPLVVRARNGDLAHYQVLVVPMDGSGDGNVAATAPQLFTNLVAADLEQNATLRLSGGVTVTGTTLTADGQPASGTRVMLSNQDPAAPATPYNLIFSSVGHSDVQGKYTLHAQPGRYWVTVAPTLDSGLSEALDPLPIALAGGATIGFAWLPPTSAPLVLEVRNAAGGLAGNTRVLVSATQSTPVGTLTFQGMDGSSLTHTANSNVQMEATADEGTGLAAFPALPANATYTVLLVPATPGPAAATTELSLMLPVEGLRRTVSLAAEAPILGQLKPGATVPAPLDWSQVQVVAFDRSQLVPEAPRSVWAQPDGSFSLGVSPGRAYAVVVWPPASTGLARTFVGPGLLQSSVFSTTQPVQATMDWTSSVSIMTKNDVVGIVGATLQTTCHPGYWRCIDPTIPLAETTSGDNGAFTLRVPDPATR